MTRERILELARSASLGDGSELSGDAIEAFAELVVAEVEAGRVLGLTSPVDPVPVHPLAGQAVPMEPSRPFQPLGVEIERERLVISIGLEALARSVESSPALESFFEHARGCGFRGPKVFDERLFAADLVRELSAETEDGTTPVHLMLDAAAKAAIENGADGVALDEEEL